MGAMGCPVGRIPGGREQAERVTGGRGCSFRDTLRLVTAPPALPLTPIPGVSPNEPEPAREMK